MSKVFISFNSEDTLVLVNSKTNKSYVEIKNKNNKLKVEKINENVNDYYSICEVDSDFLNCTSALEFFIDNSSSLNIPKEMLNNINKLYDFLYSQTYDKNANECLMNITEEYYYKVTHYNKEF